MINKIIKRAILLGFLMTFASGCGNHDTNPSTLIVQSPTLPPTLLVPSSTQTPGEQVSLDIQNEWKKSLHAQADEKVTCDICHQSLNGVITEEVARWDQNSGQYELVSNDNDLCLNCHQGYDHAETAHKDFGCLECHDQHDPNASCFDCHEQIIDLSNQIPATPVGGHNNGMDSACSGSGCHSMATQAAKMPFSTHGIQHARVACSACHDADELQVGPFPDGSAWASWISSPVDGIEVPFYSHNLQYKVNCQRCHFENNLWGLSTDATQVEN